MNNTMSVQEYRQMTQKPKRKDPEHHEQVALFNWATVMSYKYPELKLMFAIPNGGDRHVLVAMKMKAEGVKAGVPDVMLPVARGKYHGLFIEMKAGKNTASPKQKEWIVELEKQGYMVEVCNGAESAQEVVEKYITQG